ncbi:MAG: SDR family oxidoreductase [Fibrobacterota bacterium]|nr:MAG: SDR family oxidoreductase [Fibrobacterota bacterium]
MKRVVVTGVSGGIGRALAVRFAKSGYAVVGLDRIAPASLEEGETFLECDLLRIVRDETYREGVFASLHGLVRGALHLLVNNAALQIVKPIESISVDEFRSVQDVNLVAPFLLVQELLPQLEASGGSVVNIASIHATQTKPGFSAYASSKAALAGMTRAMAVELGSRVRVNAVAPAAISTPMLVDGFRGRPEAFAQLREMHPVGEIGTVDQVAQAVAFLAEPEMKFLSGSVLGLDGGIFGRLHDPV